MAQKSKPVSLGRKRRKFNLGEMPRNDDKQMAAANDEEEKEEDDNSHFSNAD